MIKALFTGTIVNDPISYITSQDLHLTYTHGCVMKLKSREKICGEIKGYILLLGSTHTVVV